MAREKRDLARYHAQFGAAGTGPTRARAFRVEPGSNFIASDLDLGAAAAGIVENRDGASFALRQLKLRLPHYLIKIAVGQKMTPVVGKRRRGLPLLQDLVQG